jgi:CheY-like chemotaxis protein
MGISMSEPTGPPPHTALVVDDDDDVRAVSVRMLGHLGIEATAVASGEQAVALLTASPSTFSLVMLDLNLASLSGKSTFEQIRGVRADIPVLFVSGGRPREISAPHSRFLEKPYSIADLRRQLGELLPDPGGRSASRSRFGSVAPQERR